MEILRTEKIDKKYRKFIVDGFLSHGCNLCNKKKTESIKEFKHWRVVKNRFPYDRIARVHHMLIPKRHVVYEKLNKIEKKEMDAIRLKFIENKYEFTMEGVSKKKTIPEHFHLHLVMLKK